MKKIKSKQFVLINKIIEKKQDYFIIFFLMFFIYKKEFIFFSKKFFFKFKFNYQKQPANLISSTI